ncbi:thioredoxin domain-containing protein [Subtercola lobariae]|uniref:Spermatogenesis-associated protein 20-like TRX domain-containing protein n=1 Tax=Subtercola lobariae TaxID=1588641 RepID=A0A917BAP5_9MICO|nr:DUF255 domain-containing protein [Subtercola lobariae]GGF28395.1 hypothetical protein GCM10011399_21990 [Subtercola lobariae]
MANRLGDAISPYLRSHAENPVDWFGWGEEAFAEAVRRDVPVLVSIGYSTCHWCHVMARESFSDPVLAAQLTAGFVAIKVDREEHPEVDATYLAAAGAFTQNLGWPLNVFVTPGAKPFFAGTYSPPVAMPGSPSFSQILAAVSDAWVNRRAEVDATADELTAVMRSSSDSDEAGADGAAGILLPTPEQLRGVVSELEAYEDTVNGGFGGAPKFPVAPVLNFLLEARAPLALRTLKVMAASELRDPVEGGFFRYATRANWSEPHYERMLYDNALLLDAYTTVAEQHPTEIWATEAAAGIAGFLIDVLQIDGGGFASAQDSESVVGGRQSEGGYYSLDAEARASEVAPKLDQKILTGWNGLAIAALAHAATVSGNARWLTAARDAADFLLEHHFRDDHTVLRATLGSRRSDARATLEDYGMLAVALLRLGSALGSAAAGSRYVQTGKALIDAARGAATSARSDGAVFTAPGGGDPVLESRGLLFDGDVSEGAYPSGLSALAAASLDVFAENSEKIYLDAARRTIGPLAPLALARPIAFGATLEVMLRLSRIRD